MPRKTVLALRHVAFEGLGAFAIPLREAGFEVRYHDVSLSPLEEVDPYAPSLLVVLGGPIGAGEDADYPFLAQEVRLLTARLEADLPTLGICLGAQLMARALGARLLPGAAREIGFAPISLTAEGRTSALAALGEDPVLHWHGDTFELPDGARLLASTEICRNQAFSWGHNALAIQFHPELGRDGFEQWLIGHAVELAASRIKVGKLREQHRHLADGLETRAIAVIEDWITRVGLVASA